MEKNRKYERLYKVIDSLCEGETDLVARMANATSVLAEELGHFWTGFYRVCGDQLVLGPFNGPVACTRIARGKGVCGSAWEQDRTLVVPNVHEFPGHIACSSLSNSEIVVPIRHRAQMIAEIDIDSREFGTFDETDAFWLDRIASILGSNVDPGLKDHIRREILPRYASFDPAHRLDHVQSVIASSLVYAGHYDVDENMCYAIAAYHDTGLAFGRERHHSESARIIREDARLREWFSGEQIELMADAAEDHRASAAAEPRSIYGKIVAEADRQIDGETIIRRTVQYGLGHYPELDREGNWQRTLEHLGEKYADGGYLRLWIPFGPNASRLEAFREIIRNHPDRLRAMFEQAYDSLVQN